MINRMNQGRSRMIFLSIVIFPVILAIVVSTYLTGVLFPVKLLFGLFFWFAVFLIFNYLRILRVIYIVIGSVNCLVLLVDQVYKYLTVSVAALVPLYLGFGAFAVVFLSWRVYSEKGCSAISEEEPGDMKE